MAKSLGILVFFCLAFACKKEKLVGDQKSTHQSHRTGGVDAPGSLAATGDKSSTVDNNVDETAIASPSPSPSPSSTPLPSPTPTDIVTTTPNCTVDTTAVTLGSVDPTELTRLLNTANIDRNLGYTGINTSLPVQRSATGSGGSFVWTPGPVDTANVTALCEILGFSAYVTSAYMDGERSGRYPQGKANFHSPHNNNLLKFVPAEKNFVTISAEPKYSNTWITTITCSGRTICN